MAHFHTHSKKQTEQAGSSSDAIGQHLGDFN